MARRATAVVVVSLLTLALAACGSGDDRDERLRAQPAVEEAGLPIRSEERTVAGMRTVVVRPRQHGPWPLVVWVHGPEAPPESYADLLDEIAAAGNVVAAPAMPGNAGAEAVLALPFQPGRVRQVIDAVTTGPYAIAAADPEHIAVAGHSLGAMTALAAGFNSCCVDRRVDAVVAVAGGLATFPGGIYSSGAIPVLLVHGTRDGVAPYTGSGEALQQVGTSAYLLTVKRGDHDGYLRVDAAVHPAVRDAMVAFLHATIGGSPQAGLADLIHAGGRPGVRLTSRG
ncbi:MAG: alpha/beta hydrolase [Acidimicrobiales bacterium]